ncbi:peptide ABC transporter substrate-binding protein [Candidatus Saccharibacteria bacterium]|nr:peptide ABC transporter substrate-binding protein [Candidatus Saccharibacteria bacterium]
MINRTTKLRWRRKFRIKKRQVEDMGSQAEEHFEKHFFKRLARLSGVRRFVIGWIVLLLFCAGGIAFQMRSLSSDFQTTVPAEGGVYSEGIIGAFTNANPIYASGAVDNSVSRLIFSGLLTYDQTNNLVGDLAESWSVDEEGLVYTVVLKPNIVWHDGEPLTSKDVVFTYRTIQNPDAKSPLLSSWRGIQIEAKDDRTIIFTLPNVLSSFPYALTNGIVPKKHLDQVPAAQLRSAKFNTLQPVGSGPFKLDKIEVTGRNAEDRVEQIGMIPFADYYNGAPKIDRFIIKSFRNEEAMLASFENRQINSMSGLDTLPDNIKDKEVINEFNIPLTGQVAVFFKNSEGILEDAKVRQALVQSASPSEIIMGLQYPVVVSDSPLLTSHLGYDKNIRQLSTNIEAAKALLEEAGWKIGDDGYRVKDGKKLTIRLYSRNTSEYTHVSQKLQDQWRAVGVEVKSYLQPNDELEGTIARHEYEALLYGIALGLDPDVFPYWHSSQADIRAPNRSNFSEYKSEVADKSLEAGRTRSDPQIRVIKYKPFLEAWRTDAPALALYQPRYLYVTRGKVYGLEPNQMNVATDRYANVASWQIIEKKVNK